LATASLVVSLAFGVGCVSAQKEEERALQGRKAVSHLNLGADHLDNQRVALALREFLLAEKFDPKNPKIQDALGEAYLVQGKPEESEAHLLRAIELHPDYHDAQLRLSGLYILEERYEESIVWSNRMIDDPTFPTPWRALQNRGLAELRLGRRDSARASLRLALDYSPDYWPASLTLSVLEAEEGHKLEAIAILRSILEIELGPRAEAEVNYRLAELYISLGRRDRAVGHLIAAVEQSPDGQWGRRSEEYLKLLR
jgi:Tfp pilus assembly protein PilF